MYKNKTRYLAAFCSAAQSSVTNAEHVNSGTRFTGHASQRHSSMHGLLSRTSVFNLESWKGNTLPWSIYGMD
jgi:hypothetical protein